MTLFFFGKKNLSTLKTLVYMRKFRDKEAVEVLGTVSRHKIHNEFYISFSSGKSFTRREVK